MRVLVAVLALAGCARAAEPARRAVLLDVDGVRRDTFEQVFAAGRLPNLARIFDQAVWFERASTVTPSVTMAAQGTIATGVMPAQHGVIGNQWYDRESGRLYDYMSAAGLSCVYGFTVLSGQECLGGLGNRHLLAKTIYEAAAERGFDSVVAYNQYWRGASRPAAPTAAEARAFLPGNKLDFKRFDTQMAGRAVAELQAHGLPAILTLYFTGADTTGHASGIGAQPDYLATVIDPLVGQVLDVIAGLDPEWRSHTLFLLTSDHGRTDVTEHAEDLTLLAEMRDALPEGTRIAQSGGMAFVYLPQADAAAGARLLEKFPQTVESVRPRAANESARGGDLVVTLRPGHYFGKSSGSHHGAPTQGDLNVPMVVAMPGVAGGRSEDEVSVAQVARTIAEFVGFPMEGTAPALPLVHEQRRKRQADR